MAIEGRMRVRTLPPRLKLGPFPPRLLNSLIDVPEVLVHTQSIILPENSMHSKVNTGVTTILSLRD